MELELTREPEAGPTANRLGKVLSTTADAVVVQGIDGRARTISAGLVEGNVVHGDHVALGGDGKMRPYALGVDGKLPKEALDTQIFADIRRTGQLPGMSPSGQPHGEQLRINARNELAAHYKAESANRALELVAAGVLKGGGAGLGGGGLTLTENWREAYIAERKSVGRSERPEAEKANSYIGLVKEVGALSRQGQRGILLETPDGSAFVATQATKVAQGSVVAVERENDKQPWAIRSVGEVQAQRVREALEKQAKEDHEKGRDRKKSRSRSDLER